MEEQNNNACGYYFSKLETPYLCCGEAESDSLTIAVSGNVFKVYLQIYQLSVLTQNPLFGKTEVDGGQKVVSQYVCSFLNVDN